MSKPLYPFKDISADLGGRFEYKGFTGTAHITRNEWECIRKYTKEKKYLEIGSYQGYSTTAADQAEFRCCIDLKIRPLVKTLAKWIEADSTTPSTYNGIPSHLYEFILIDGNHTYDYCSQDLTNYYPKLKEGGIIAIHDYGIQGDYLGKWGVAQAVDEFFHEDQYIETVDSLILFTKIPRGIKKIDGKWYKSMFNCKVKPYPNL